MTNPSIGIIIPVFSVKREYFEQCVLTAINQTYENVEVILVDDCSPNGCGEWCDEYAKQYKNVKVIHHETNKGVGASRNDGARLSKSDYLMFVDADDWLDLDTCEKSVDYLLNSKQPLDTIIFSSYKNYSSYEEKPSTYFQENTLFSTYEEREQLQIKCLEYITKKYSTQTENLDTCWGKLFSRKLFLEKDISVPLIPHREDNIFFLKLCEQSSNILYVTDHFYHYRFVEGSAVNSYRPSSSKEQLDYVNELLKFAKANNKNDQFIEKCRYSIFLSSQIVITNQFFNKDNRKSHCKRQKECRNYLKQEPFKSSIKGIKAKDLRKAHKIKLILIRMHLYFAVSLLKSMFHSAHNHN